jgi:RNAse (barnase) inhibitor barstar
MQELVMDGKNWNTADDVYETFFKAAGAPSWHGHNFNALRDSIVTGHINRIEVPYCLKVKNYASIGAGAKNMADNFVQLIKELHESGCPVDIEVES